MTLHKVLWIVAKSPLPAHDGARRATDALLGSLQTEALELNLLILEAETQSLRMALEKQYKLASLTFVARSPLAGLGHRLFKKVVGPLTPYTFQSFASEALRTFVARHIENLHPDTIVADGLHSTVTIPESLHHKVIYRAHNVESELWARWAASQQSVFLRLFGKLESILVKRIEKRAIKNVHATAAISSRDGALLQRMLQGSTVITVPAGFDFVTPLPLQKVDELRLLWIGKLDWKPNREGLEWFLSNVWPSLPSAISLTIIGSGESNIALPNTPRIRLLRNVKDLIPHYTWADLALVPIRYGSGTRLKAIEAASHGRACIGTTIGLEGLPLEHERSALIGNDAQTWIMLIASLTHEKAVLLGNAAFATLAPEWNKQAAAAHFLSLMQCQYSARENKSPRNLKTAKT